MTSSWHRARAGVLFRSLLPGVPGDRRRRADARLAEELRAEVVVFPLVPLQLPDGRAALSRRGGGAAA